MSNTPAILAEGLHKHYGKTHALAGLDLVAEEGSVLGLLGPNGAGKTTAVRILTTLLRPDAGRAQVRSEERRVGKEGRCGWWGGQAEDGIRDKLVTGVQTCALPIYTGNSGRGTSQTLRKDARAGRTGPGCRGGERAWPAGPQWGRQDHRRAHPDDAFTARRRASAGEIGRASCRERG